MNYINSCGTPIKPITVGQRGRVDVLADIKVKAEGGVDVVMNPLLVVEVSSSDLSSPILIAIVTFGLLIG